MNFQSCLDQNDSFVFEFDNVLYPEKDYFLQVYYLFAQFIEYAEQISANEVLTYMKNEYETQGADEVFYNTIRKFNIPEKYKVNFELLLTGARLPLKLVLYQDIHVFLNNIVASGKQVFLFTKGSPETQLNKIKQTEWEGLAENLTVYFAEEIGKSQTDSGLSKIVATHNLKPEKTIFISNNAADLNIAEAAGVKYLNISKLLTK